MRLITVRAVSAAAVLASCAPACTGYRGAGDARTRPGGGERAVARGSATPNEDSLSLAEAALFESDDPPADVLPRPPAPPPDEHDVPRRRTGQVTGIGGYRPEYRATLRSGGLRAGLKANDAARLGYVAYAGSGRVRQVVLGNLTLRAGLRLILGRRLGGYPSPSAGPVRRGFAAAPSLSAWSGRDGAAVEFGAAGWSVHAVTVHGSAAAAPRLRPAALWLAAQREGKAGAVGLAWGRVLRSRPVDGGAGRLGGGACLLNASWGGSRYRVSGEWAHAGPRAVYYALRVWRRGIASVTVYRAPALSTGSDPAAAVLPVDRPRRGGRLEVRQRLGGGVALVASASAMRARGPAERRASRFWRVGVSGASGWTLSAERRVTRRRRFTTTALDPAGGAPATRTETRVRAIVSIRESAATSHRLRFECFPSASSPGALLSASTRVSIGALHAEWRVTKYALPAGVRGIVTRPGVGSFEFFSVVAGTGSDVAARVRLRLGGGIEILGAYVDRGPGEPRIYLGMRATR